MCGVPEAFAAASMIYGGFEAHQQKRAHAAGVESQTAYFQQKAALEEERLRRQARRAASRQRARYAKSGVRISGSPEDVMADLVGEGELDARLAGYSLRQQAGNLSREAASLRSDGDRALRGSLVNAGLMAGKSLFTK